MADMRELTRAETIIGGLFALGLLVLAVKKVLNFFGLDIVRKGNGKPPDAERKCPDPGCHRTVEQIGEDVDHLCRTVEDDIFPKINRTAEAIARIEGWIQGQRGPI